MDSEWEPEHLQEIEKARNRGLTRVGAILAAFEMDEVQSSVAPSQMAESVMASTIGGRSVNQGKFLELLEQARGLLGDLQDHEEDRETRAAEFYNPRGVGTPSPIDTRPHQPAASEESPEGRIIPRGRQVLQRDVELLRENDEGFQDFQQRKETLLSHVTNLAKIKYDADPQKQKDVVAFVETTLREEEMAVAASRKHSIMSRRATNKSAAKGPDSPLSREEIRSFAADLR